MNLKSPKLAGWAGLIGCAFVLAGILISAFGFKGAGGESFDPANHFISELGKYEQSDLAWTFNGGAMLGAAFLSVFNLALGQQFDSHLASVAMLCGLIASMSAAAVGYYPAYGPYVDNHVMAALGFFTMGCLTCFVFGLAMVLDKRKQFPKGFFAISLLLAALYFTAIFWSKDSLEAMVESPGTWSRPSYWVLTLLEWATGSTVGIWISSVSIYLLLKPSDFFRGGKLQSQNA